MAKKINGELWYYVDTICDELFIYDIYQNDRDETIYIKVDVLY